MPANARECTVPTVKSVSLGAVIPAMPRPPPVSSSLTSLELQLLLLVAPAKSISPPLFCYTYVVYRDLHSFPTRRSSDLRCERSILLAAPLAWIVVSARLLPV